jgi:hypothetical protein
VNTKTNEHVPSGEGKGGGVEKRLGCKRVARVVSTVLIRGLCSSKVMGS